MLVGLVSGAVVEQHGKLLKLAAHLRRQTFRFAQLPKALEHRANADNEREDRNVDEIFNPHVSTVRRVRSNYGCQRIAYFNNYCNINS